MQSPDEQFSTGASQQPLMQIKSRPTFLMVLCIFSFIGIGIAVISSMYNMFIYSGDTARQMLDHANQVLQESNSPFGTFTENTDAFISATFTMNLVNLIASLVCLTGVLLMWNLKKAGFYFYLVGEIAYPIVAIILSGRAGIGHSFFSSLMFIGIFITIIFSIAFIIMYAVNLKHMK